MRRCILYFMVGLLLCSARIRVVDYTDSYVGYAYERGNSKPVYSEEFTDHFVNNRYTETVTHYFDPNKKLIARRTLDFSRSLFAPDFRTEDLRTGSMEGAELKNEKVRLFFRKDKNSPLKEKTIDVPQPVVIDGGFNQFIKARWVELEQGETIVFNFTVPAHLDFYRLKATRVSDPTHELIIRIEPDHLLVRWMAEPILVNYNRFTKRIVSYEGKSNIANEYGRNAFIKLIYPEKGP